MPLDIREEARRSPRRAEIRRARETRKRAGIAWRWPRAAKSKWGLLLLAVVIVAGLIAATLLPDETPSTGSFGTSAEAERADAGPYELVQAPVGFNLDQVVDAKFVSITFSGSEGVSSVMLASDRPEFAEMAAAVAGSKPTSGEEAAGATGDTLTLTFVTDQRETVSLSVGRDSLFTWQGSSYRAAGDLENMARQASKRG